MILHCTTPYARDIPNPALGYLKGFLQARGIEVKNVYWNLILFTELTNIVTSLETSSNVAKSHLFDAATVYIWKHLVTGGPKIITPIDLLFKSVFTRDEISTMINSIKDKIDWYIRENSLHKASLAGFTFKTYQWMMNSYVMSRLKELNPDIAVVIGGITNESQGHAFMEVFPLADFAIWGEGEYPLYYLSRALEEDAELKNVPHLIYRDGKDTHSTEKSSEYPHLDLYPFADHSDYFDTLKKFVPASMKVLIPVWGSRSCPWNRCKFCVLNEEYHYRTRSPENIVKEIEVQSETHGVDSFIFVDTELPGNRNRFLTLLHLLIKISADRKEPYHFIAEISPVFIDSETAKYMQLASFVSIQMGFEAMTESLLEKMEKRHRFAHNIQALKLGNQYGLEIEGLNIIKGIPTETKEDILGSCSNLKFLRFLLNTYPLSPGFLELYKGSPFYMEMLEEDRTAWNYHRLWEEIASLNLISEDGRFEFFGFCTDRLPEAHVWDDFEMIMASYKRQNRSYTWIDYPEGSFVEERGPEVYKFILDRDETDILIFCDSIKTLSEVRERFPHIDEDSLCELLSNLKEFGLVYYDEDMCSIISVLEAFKRNRATQVLL